MPGHYARAIRLTASYAAGDSILCYAPWHCMLSRAALYANGKIIVCHAGRGLTVSPAPYSLPPVTDDGITVVYRPPYERVKMWQQRVCTLCQRIFDPRGHFGIHSPRDVAVFLQRPQGDGQHFLRYVGDGTLQFLEAHRTFARFVQSVYDQQRPLVAQPGKDVAYRALGEKGIFDYCPVHIIEFQITLQR